MKACSLVAGLLVLGAGCGWHTALQAPAGTRSIGVEVARREGHVLERDLEPLFTDALSRAVSDWVDVPLDSPHDADLIVRAELLEYRRRSGVRNVENELIETAVFIRATATLFDRRQGLEVGPPALAQIWSGYSLEEASNPANEEAARDRALRTVAETLVLDLFQRRELEARSAEPVP